MSLGVQRRLVQPGLPHLAMWSRPWYEKKASSIWFTTSNYVVRCVMSSGCEKTTCSSGFTTSCILRCARRTHRTHGNSELGCQQFLWYTFRQSLHCTKHQTLPITNDAHVHHKYSPSSHKVPPTYEHQNSGSA